MIGGSVIGARRESDASVKRNGSDLSAPTSCRGCLVDRTERSKNLLRRVRALAAIGDFMSWSIGAIYLGVKIISGKYREIRTGVEARLMRYQG